MTEEMKQSLQGMLCSGDSSNVDLAIEMLHQHLGAETADWNTLIWHLDVMVKAQAVLRTRIMYIPQNLRKPGNDYHLYTRLCELDDTVATVIVDRLRLIKDHGHNMHLEFWIEIFRGLNKEQQLKFNETIISNDEEDNLFEH